MAQAMDMAEMSGLVVRNTFLEFSGQDNCFEENLPNQRTRAFSDILDTKLPWKVPITSNLDSGLFQITRKRITSDSDVWGGLDLPVREERPATISQEAGSRVPPQFPLPSPSPYANLMPMQDLPNPWLAGLGWPADLPLWNSGMPNSSLAAAATAAAMAQMEARRNYKKDMAEARPKKKMGENKQSKEIKVQVGAQADKVPQPELSTDPTTVMLRHIPNRYTSLQLVELLDAKGFQAKYDFVYLPIDFQNKVNLGYCFVNLRSHEWALRFKEEFEGFKEWRFDSVKASEVSWAHPHQGLNEHIERYRNSPVMHFSMPAEYKPMIFNDGIQIPFPAPTRTIKVRRLPRGMK